MKTAKNRCPECKKLMIRCKRQTDFWWTCSGYPRCFVIAQDYKGKPEYVQKEQQEKIDFLNQLKFINEIIKTPRAQILVRLVQRKGGLDSLSSKHQLMYYELIEPIRASISFARCCRCNLALDAKESLKFEEGWYECDWCWNRY